MTSFKDNLIRFNGSEEDLTDKIFDQILSDVEEFTIECPREYLQGVDIRNSNGFVSTHKVLEDFKQLGFTLQIVKIATETHSSIYWYYKLY